MLPQICVGNPLRKSWLLVTRHSTGAAGFRPSFSVGIGLETAPFRSGWLSWNASRLSALPKVERRVMDLVQAGFDCGFPARLLFVECFTANPVPKFHLILASEASTAVLIRRGPKKWSCVFGWDRAGDTFQPGQCVKGYLEAKEATLSPCGKYFAYAVRADRMAEKGYFQTCIYSAVSRPPWLKALVFWNRYGGCDRQIM